MPLVFSCLVPHPPLIIPTIGREHAKKLEKTSASYGKIALDLAAARPDAVIVISPHLAMMQDNFTVNHAEKYFTHFLEFGDFSPSKEFPTDSLIVERIRHHARRAGHRVVTVSDEHLDYGSGVALEMLCAARKGPACVVVSPTMEGAKAQFAFGQTVKEAVAGTGRRVAVICSADLSHRLSSDTPSGFSPKGKEFDDQFLATIATGKASPVLQMDHDLVEEAHACGYNAACMLLGIMDRVDYEPELLSYEAPFGVGYAAIEFHLR